MKKSNEFVYSGAILTGLASRSGETSRTHRLYRDGHAAETDFKAAVDRDEKKILSAQKAFAYKSGGQLAWLDALRPLTRCFQGFALRETGGDDAVGPVTRWFRTNTFYRKPLVNGKLDVKDGGPADFLPSLPNAVAFLPAPYTFARLVENSYYESEEALANDYAKAVAKSSKKLQEKGYRCLLLSDPYVGYEISKGKRNFPEWIPAAVSKAKTQGIKLGINFPLASAGDIVRLGEDSNADFIGLDATHSSDFKIDTEKDVLLGVVDGGRAIVENQDAIESRVEEFLAGANFSGNYYIGPNDRLFDVPFETALEKIGALSAFRVSQ